MMRKLLIAALLTYTIIQVQSCCKGECLEGDVTVSFQNYTKAEVDTVIFVGTWGTEKDSFAVVTPVTGAATEKSSLIRSLYPRGSWRVEIPSVNKTFEFANFQFEEQKCECGGGKVNLMRSYTVNGAKETRWYYPLPR